MKNINVATKAIILNKADKILTVYRSATDDRRPLTWDLPGGIVEIGEDLGDSLRREIKEEAGIEVGNLKLHDVIGRYNKRQEYWITIAYIARAKSEKVVLSFEHAEYKWVTKAEFLKLNASDRQKEFVSKL